MMLLGKVAANSLIKITLQAEPSEYYGKVEQSGGKEARDVREYKIREFRRKFERVLPTPSAYPPVKSEDFAYLVQEMLQIASQKALPSALSLMFQPLSSFYYSDGTNMFTLTGAVCARSDAVAVRHCFDDWAFRNLNWGKPKEINVPVLTTKERLHIQHLLPCTANAGKVLRQALGYLIDRDKQVTEAKLEQYADFHRYFPYFVKATP
jgi:Putative O-methyltransferase